MSSARAVLFDFDGPLCHVFAGLPAPSIARELADILGDRLTTDDPLEVLVKSTQYGPGMLQRIEDALISAEISAVECSTSTPGGVESVRACLSAGLPVGIVSNNSAEAVSTFLNHWNLIGKVKPVIGRAYLHPEWMKPSVKPLERALQELGCAPAAAVFVGDSRSDIQVATAVGVPCVAYANKPGKRHEFSTMGAIVIDSMWDVAAAIRGRAS
jgi:phosphoglycolate phosphatase-like HAD superfamily hydrolase